MSRLRETIIPRGLASFGLAGVMALISTGLDAADCNGNGEDDAREIASGSAPDCNGNGVPDACDLEAPGFQLSPGVRFEDPRLSIEHRLADLDGDGQVDLLGIAGSDPRWFGAYLRNEDGTFPAEPEPLWTFGLGGWGLEADDLDGDTDNDVVLFQPFSSVLVLGNDGAGRLSLMDTIPLDGGETPHRSLAVDLDGDGDLDLAVSAFRLHVLFNVGGLTFSATQAIPGVKGTGGLATADLDDDGDTDLVLSYDTHDGIAILRNDGLGALLPPEHHSSGGTEAQRTGGRSVFASDIDGDGWQDIVSSNAPWHDGSLFQNDARGGLLPPLHFPAIGRAHNLVLADLDGGGPPDLVAVDSLDGEIRALLNSGSTFAESVFVASADAASNLFTIDFDRDGRTDLANIYVDRTVNRIVVRFLMNGARARSLDCDGSGIPDECEIYAGAAGDCNANGFPDACEIERGEATDCDGNGIPDACDIAPPAVRLSGPGVMAADTYDNRITPADLDGDGDADLAVSNIRGEDVSIFRNNSDGSLRPRIRFGVRGQPEAVIGADLDGDEHTDLVVPGSEFINVLLNEGNGLFAPARSFTAGAAPFSAAVTDVDGDGRRDIVAANLGSGDLSVLRGDGGGNFAEAARVPTVPGPLRISSDDLDNDGDVDLAIGSNDTKALAIHLHSDGELEEPLLLEIAEIPGAFATGDIDGDGDSDIAVTLGSTVHFLLASGATIAAEQVYVQGMSARQQLILSDIDGDRDIDLITRSGSSVIVQRRGSDEYVAEDPHLSADVAVADLDLDGLVDLTGVDSRLLSVRLQLDGGGFVPHGEALAGDQARHATAADLNGDGDIDLVVVTEGLALFENDGTGRPHAGPRLETDPFPIAAACGDLDGDGDQDIAAIHSTTPRVVIFFNRGEGVFPVLPDSRVDVGNQQSALALADVEGDGDQDLLCTAWVPGFPSKVLTVSRNDGSGIFASPEIHSMGSIGASLVAADLDGDGSIDAVVDRANRIEYLRNAGDGTFEMPVEVGAASRVKHLVTGDIDLDGNEDIAAVSDEHIFIAFNDGGGSFPTERAIPIGGRLEPVILALLDLSLDGAPDVAVARRSDRDLRLLINLGTREFLEVPAPSISGTPAYVLGAEMDGDGRDDIVLVKTLPGTAAVLLNKTFAGGSSDCNANGLPDVCELDGEDCDANGVLDACDLLPGFTLEEPLPILDAPPSGGVAAGDWDLDGWTDLAATGTASPGNEQVVILRNDGQGGFAPTPYPVAAYSPSLHAADLDGDGDADLALGETAVLLLNNGDGSFEPAASPFFAPPHWVTDDWDADGRPDVALLSGGGGGLGSLQVLLQTDHFQFAAGPRFLGIPAPRDVAAADVDGDSRLDLLVSSESGSLLFFAGDGAGSFEDPRRIPLADKPMSMAVADLDADGDVDVALAFEGVTILFNEGDGAFPTTRYLPASAIDAPVSASPGIESLHIADMDGDSLPDIVAGANRAVYLFRNVGGGSFAPARRHLGVTPRMAVLDHDRDGDRDLAIAGVRDFTSANQVTLHLIAGRRTPPQGRDDNSNGLLDGCEDLAFHRGDANGDGILNIVDPIFSFLYLFSEGRAPPCLEAADATDDGRVNISDPIRALDYLFLGTSPPPSPGPPPAPCGLDPPGDGSFLGCASYGRC
jgi:hypothetical protein